MALFSAAAGGDFATPLPALSVGQSGYIELDTVFFAFGSNRFIVQGDTGAANDKRNTVQLSGDLQTAELWGTDTGGTGGSTFSVAVLGMQSDIQCRLRFTFDRTVGGTRVVITSANAPGAPASARLDFHGDIRSISSGQSVNISGIAGGITRVRVEYPGDSRYYVIDEGQGTISSPGNGGGNIIWRSPFWVVPNELYRTKIVNSAQARRGTIFAHRIG